MRPSGVGFAVTILLGIAAPLRGQDSLPELSTLESRVRDGDSLDGMTQFRLALRYEVARRYDDEERALRTAIAADPRLAPPYVWLADLPYLRDKDLAKEEQRHQVPPDRVATLDSATRFRIRAFAVNPFGDVHLLEGNPLPQGTIVLPDRQSEATTRYLRWVGVVAYFAARYDLSFSALDLYWSRRYGNRPADSIPTVLLFYHGLAATQEGMLDRAERDFQVLVDRNATVEESDSLLRIPLNGNRYRYLLAIIKERENKPLDAIQLYQDIVSRDLGFYMAHARLAQIYRQYKMWDKAVPEAQAAVEANPDDASLLVDLGAIDREAGHLADAQAALKKATTIDARYPEAYYRLGIVSQELNHPAPARDALTRFIAVAPHSLGSEVDDARKRLATVQ